jgi:UDP-N-acetylmuramate dehydrogenase
MVTSVQLTSVASDGAIQAQIPLARFTSFRVGGPAEWYVAPKTLEELQDSFEWADRRSVPVTLLGAGSNLLVSDGGIEGLTVSTRHLRRMAFDHEAGRVTVGAGVSIATLAWKAAALGWSGLEWAVGIPGSLGGSAVMNAGAHGGEMKDVLLEAEVLSADGKRLETLAREDFGYGYRTSALQGDRRLVTQTTLQLTPGFDPALVKARTRKHLEQRHSTQPYHMPSCGSVFRNPEPQKAAWLIEQTGLKGLRRGDAEVAQMHANFILNCGEARATDILGLIESVREAVYHRWDVVLHPEVKMLGAFGAIAV